MTPPQSKATRFAHYARYYDLLYENKDYSAEARFVHRRLKSAGAKRGALLELGCGTGRHALALSELGWKVEGYDLSSDMIARARRHAEGSEPGPRPEFSVGDMVNLRTGRMYDAVASLFHVLGYQTTTKNLIHSLQTAAVHLRPGGIFLFDFWFGPAVLSDKPSVRVKRAEDDRIRVTRISEPTLDVIGNKVSIDFDVTVEDKRAKRADRIRERHDVRYFFYPELEHLLGHVGFDIESCGEWMSEAPLSCRSWYGWIAATRRPDGSKL